MQFSKTQVKDFVKQVRKSVGDGWRFMIPEVREAMIVSKAAFILMGQVEETTFTSKDVQALIEAMLKEAGLSS